MYKKLLSLLLCIALVVPTFPVFAGGLATVVRDSSIWELPLNEWKIAPESKISFAPWTGDGVGDAKAQDFDTSNWIKAQVPGTVLGALIDEEKYDNLFKPNNKGDKDVYFDANMMEIPRDDFAGWWWYSIDFNLPAEESAKNINLNLNMISYQGEIFVNGTKVENRNITVREREELLNKAEEGAIVDRRAYPTAITGAPAGGTPMPNTGGEFANVPAAVPFLDTLSASANNARKLGMTVSSNPRPPYVFFSDDIAANAHAESSALAKTNFSDYSKEFMGTYRSYDVNITDLVGTGSNNIKVRVKRMFNVRDFGPFWHDWHPAAPDNNMGINGKATLSATGAVRLDSPLVTTVVEKGSVIGANGNADLSFYVEATNMTNSPVTAVITGRVLDPEGVPVPGISFNKTEVIPGGEYRWEIPVLVDHTFNNARLWWPLNSGDQPLYFAEYTVLVDGVVSDKLTHRFGIRQLYHEVTKFSDHAQSYQPQIYVNHQPVLMKGGGFSATDMFYRHNTVDYQSLIDVLQMMGHNFLRDEGKFFSEDLYDLFDENGILVMTGYMCCDRNEDNPNTWAEVERFIVYESTYSQMRSLRSHASAWSWLNGSDYAKDNDSKGNSLSGFNVHRKMMEIGGRMRWNEIGSVFSHASGLIASGGVRWSRIIGASDGLEMDHGYDTLVPASFFTEMVGENEYTGNPTGTRGTFGFISEGSGGSGVPVVETLRRMIPDGGLSGQRSYLWPYNEGGNPTLTNAAGFPLDPGNYNKWSYHACRAAFFERIDTMISAVDNNYGPSENIDEFSIRAQLFQYDYNRANHEALNMRRYRHATGFVNWMLNGPRPSTYWNQFDFYFNPHGGTYGTAKGNTPVHIMYNPYQKDVYVINNTREVINGATATLKMYDIYGNQINNTLSQPINIGADGISGWSNPEAVVMRTTAFQPTTRNGKDWYKAAFEPVETLYSRGATNLTTGAMPGSHNPGDEQKGRRAIHSTGLNFLWDAATIEASKIRPTTDVYFVSLELKQPNGELLSRNDYAVGRRMDVMMGDSTWNTKNTSQQMDLTQLNELPFVELDVAVSGGNSVNGLHREMVVAITNLTDDIAHGVEIKTYTDGGKEDLVPATYSDNLLTLFPRETRTITVRYLDERFDNQATIHVDCYNNIIMGKPMHGGNIYAPIDPEVNSLTSLTTNLAKGNGATGTVRAGVGLAVANAPTTWSDTNNMIHIADVLDNNGNRVPVWDFAGEGRPAALNSEGGRLNHGSNTVLDSNIHTSQAITPGQAGFIDLGAVKVFDRVMVRWNRNSTGGSDNNRGWDSPLQGVPDFVDVHVSADGETWKKIIDHFDNTKGRSVMTNFIFEKPESARYIRVTPRGLTTPSAGYGVANVANRIGGGTPNVIVAQAVDPLSGRLNDYVRARLTERVFNIAAVEVYQTYNYVLVEIDPASDISVRIAGIDIEYDSPLATRLIKVPSNGNEFPVIVDLDSGTWDTPPGIFLNNIRLDTSYVQNSGQVESVFLNKTGQAESFVNGYSVLYLSKQSLFNIVFDSKGGSKVNASEPVATGTQVQKPIVDPVKAGSEFLGWFTDDPPTAPVSWPIMVTVDTTLFAGWSTQEYTVTFDWQDGEPPTEVVKANVHHGDKLTAADAGVEPAPPVAGQTFVGWFRENGITEWVFADNVVENDITLFGRWIGPAGTITAVPIPSSDAGTITGVEGAQDLNIGQTFSMTAMPAAGFGLRGWFEAGQNVNLSSALSPIFVAKTGLSLEARFEPVYRVSVTIVPEGAGRIEDRDSIGSQSQTASLQANGYADYFSDVNLRLRATNSSGFSYDGWFIDGERVSTGRDYNFTTTSSPVNLEMRFIDNSAVGPWSVTFNADGGEPEPEAQTITHNGRATKPTDPTKGDDTFLGWFLGETATEFDFINTPITDDITLTARWQAFTPGLWTVTFDPNNDTAVEKRQIADGEPVGALPEPIRPGFVLVGWFIEGGVQISSNTLITADVTFIAHWDEEPPSGSFYAYFDTQGGSPEARQEIEDGGYAIRPATSPIKDNYVFIGWFTAAIGGDEFNFEATPITQIITIFAQWESVVAPTVYYNVVFISNGGSEVDSVKMIDGGLLTRPADPTRIGYTFGGWFKESALTNLWNFAVDTVDSDMTLYAKWTANVIDPPSPPRAPARNQNLPKPPSGGTMVDSTPVATPTPTPQPVPEPEPEQEPQAPTYSPMKPIDEAGVRVSSVKSSNTLLIGGEEKVFPAVNIRGYNWLKLRDLAMILLGTDKGFSLRYDAGQDAIIFTSGGVYTPIGDELKDLPGEIAAIASPQKLYIDGVLIEVAAYNIDGYNYFRLRDLAIILDFAVEFAAATGQITLDLERPYSE